MHVGEVVITHVLSETQVAAPDGSSAAILLHAAAHLGVLSSSGQLADGTEAVGQLVAKARAMLSNKQVIRISQRLRAALVGCGPAAALGAGLFAARQKRFQAHYGKVGSLS